MCKYIANVKNKLEFQYKLEEFDKKTITKAYAYEDAMAIVQEMQVQNIPAIFKKGIELALEGDTEMVRYFIDRMLGKPTQSFIVSHQDSRFMGLLSRIHEAIDGEYKIGEEQSNSSANHTEGVADTANSDSGTGTIQSSET